MTPEQEELFERVWIRANQMKRRGVGGANIMWNDSLHNCIFMATLELTKVED